MSKRKVIYSLTINSRCKGCRICVSKCRQNVLDIVNDEYRSDACSEHPEACAGCENANTLTGESKDISSDRQATALHYRKALQIFSHLSFGSFPVNSYITN